MLAIIPARGGSKGVQRKNIRMLGGKPLIQWTIEAALQADTIDRVIISTDDDEIAEVCRSTGVEIPFMRPIELAQDDSLAIDNYIYTVDRLAIEADAEIKDFCVLLPTVPFRNSNDIDDAIQMFESNHADSVISCTQLLHPVEWIFDLSDSNRIIRELDKGDKKIINRQALSPMYIPNGGIYIFKYCFLKRSYTYYSENTYGYVMPTERSIDIDTEYDFKLAEFIAGEEYK